MGQKLGYTQPLFIQPFDHRSSFMKKMFGIDARQPTAEETTTIAAYKKIIYDGFKLAVASGVPKESAAILVDEQFGDQIIKDAIKNQYIVCVATEKSGQDEFNFEYGDKFAEHINKYKPTFAKALLRYNPAEDAILNARQRAKLKQLSDFCHQNGYKFIIEPLVPATEIQLASVNGDQNRYDNELRPELMIQMVSELQADGVEPDVWKIEGLEQPEAYQKMIAQMRANGRNQVSAIVLGRGADATQVKKWLAAGASVEGIIGFAIGRTVFWQPLLDYKAGKINPEQTAEQIGKNYQHFYQFFQSQKS